MKKKIIILVLGLMMIVGARAQKLGLIGGPSMNYGVYWTENQYVQSESLPNAGFHVGGLFEWDITNRWGWDAAIMYEMRSSKFKMNYNSSDTTTMFSRQLFYFNVPLHIYVNIPIKNKYVVSFFAGPSISIGLHGQDAAWLLTDNRKPVTYMDDQIFDKDKGRVMRFEVAAEVGMSFKYRNYQARLAYQHGITNSTSNGYQMTMPLSSSTANYYTQGTLRFSFAYLFDLSR